MNRKKGDHRMRKMLSMAGILIIIIGMAFAGYHIIQNP